MKKYSLLLLLVITVLSSCEDATEIVQLGELNQDAAFQTVADIQTGLNNAYNRYAPEVGGNGVGTTIFYNAIITDNVKRGINSNGQGTGLFSFNILPANGSATAIWDLMYNAIFQANTVMEASENVESILRSDATLTTEELGAQITELNHIRAQALGLRALSHFELYKYFTPDYEDALSLSCITLDFVPNPLDQFERNTAGEVLEFILQDLVTAESLFDTGNPIANNVNFVTLDFFKALRAQVALFDRDYPLARDLANELVSDFPLTNASNFQNIWSDFSLDELIYVKPKVNGDRGSLLQLFASNTIGATGGAFLEASNQLYNLYDDNDVRKATYFHPDTNIISPDNPNNEIYINKYPGSGDDPTLNDVKVFRSAEFLLIRAEAQARLEDFPGAIASIQQLRTARYNGNPPPAPNFNTIEDALDVILEERRKELSFEGYRFIDLKRTGRSIVRNPVDCESFSAPCELTTGDFRFTLPIPQAEINANSVISQNPGY